MLNVMIKLNNVASDNSIIKRIKTYFNDLFKFSWSYYDYLELDNG